MLRLTLLFSFFLVRVQSLGTVSGRSGVRSSQQLNCYERSSQMGDSVSLTEYAPILDNYNFDNRAVSCCFKGIWILYDGEVYNSGKPSLTSYHGWGEGYCSDLGGFKQLASSARFAGAPDGYKYSVLNLYQDDNYGGEEQYLYGDQPVLEKPGFGKSVILAGCEPWTLYDNEGYYGNSLCLRPSDPDNCYPSFFTQRDLGSFAGRFYSARRGCLSLNVIKGDLENTMKARIGGPIENL